MAEVYFNFTILCIDICKTWNQDMLDTEDKICLQNCGYNRMYLHRYLLEAKIAMENNDAIQSR